MRPLLVAAAVCVGMLSGCTSGTTGFAFVTTNHGLTFEKWTNIAADQVAVKARVGEVLHLSLGTLPAGMTPPGNKPPLVRLQINGKDIVDNEFYLTGDTWAFVYRPSQAGEYHLKLSDAFNNAHVVHVWDITIAE
jgi:hypothetical protein